MNKFILTNFYLRSKVLFAPRRKVLFPSLGVLILFLSLAGCFYNLNVDKSFSREVNFQNFQPVALLPIPDAAGYPQSGSDLNSFIYTFLAAKGYTLIPPGEVSAVLQKFGFTPPLLLANQSSLIKTNERLKAKAYGHPAAIFFAETLRSIRILSGLGGRTLRVPGSADLSSGDLSDPAGLAGAGDGKGGGVMDGRRKNSWAEPGGKEFRKKIGRTPLGRASLPAAPIGEVEKGLFLPLRTFLL